MGYESRVALLGTAYRAVPWGPSACLQVPRIIPVPVPVPVPVPAPRAVPLPKAPVHLPKSQTPCTFFARGACTKPQCEYLHPGARPPPRAPHAMPRAAPPAARPHGSSIPRAAAPVVDATPRTPCKYVCPRR